MKDVINGTGRPIDSIGVERQGPIIGFLVLSHNRQRRMR